MIFYKALFWEFILISNMYNFEINIINKKFILGIFFILTFSLKMLDYNYFFIIPIVLIFIQAMLFKRNNNMLKNFFFVSISIILFAMNHSIISRLVWNLPTIQQGVLRGHHRRIAIGIYVLVSAACFIESKVIGKYIKKLNLDEIIRKKHCKIIATLVLTIMNIAIILYMNSTIGSRMGFKKCLDLMNTDIFIFYFLLNFILLYCLSDLLVKRIEYRHKIRNLSNLNEYTKNIESLYSEIRNVKHDYTNIILTISGYIDNSDLEGLREYFNNNIIKYNKNLNKKINTLPLLSNLKILELKGLISSKLLRADYLKIEVKVDISDEINFINMNIIDVCRIMGILLDNAIEASVEHKEPRIMLSIVKSKNGVVLVVSNNYVEPIAKVQEMFQSGFSTKGRDRGLGLTIVKKILSEYEKVFMETTIDNGQVIQLIKVENVGGNL